MKYLSKLMICITMLIVCSNKSYSATSFQQTIVTTIPSAVNISAYNQSLAKGSIAPQTGISTSPSASFNIKTNGEDCNYNYIVQAKLSTSNSRDVNAYSKISNRDYIILGNVSSGNYPNINAVNNIKSGTPTAAGNPNVIAYPINNILTNIDSATMVNNSAYGGLCYSVKMGNSQNGNFVQSIGSVPLNNTYSISNDRAGTYQAIVTFTANRNP